MEHPNKLLSLIFTTIILATILPSTAYTKEGTQNEVSIFEQIGDIGVQKASKKGLTTPVNEEIIMNGQTVLFTESLYDGSSIHLAYKIKSYKEKDSTSLDRLLDDFEFSKNGTSLFIGGMSAGGELLENGDYAGTMTLDFHEKIPDSFTLSISSRKDDSVRVEIPIILKGKAKFVPVNVTKKSANKEITFNSVTLYPTTVKIQLQNIINEDQEHFHMDINIKVTDEKGHILQPLRGGSSGVPLGNGKIKVTSNYYFEPLEPIPNSLFIQPYLQDFKENQEPVDVRKKWKGKGFTLSQGDAGSLTILDVKKEKDLFIVTYKISGKQNHQQAATLWVENIKGKHYPGNYPPKQLGENKFQVSFSSVAHLKEFYIGTAKLDDLNYIKDLETTVKLKD